MKRDLEEEWEGRRGIPYKVLPGDGGILSDVLTAMNEIEMLFDETGDVVWYAHQGMGPWQHTWQLLVDAAAK